MENDPQRLLEEIKRAKAKLRLYEDAGQLAQLQKQAAAPDFWSRSEDAAETAKTISRLENRLRPWLDLEDRAKELLEMSKLDDPELKTEIEAESAELASELDHLKAQLKLAGPYDDHNAILSIHAGTGGVDAMDWAQMLERMYMRYAQNAGMKASLLEESAGDEAGIKHALLKLEGDYAYGRLKSEHGVHRLVRLSPFNANNLRQTSFALVEILPEIERPDEAEVDEKDLKVDVFRAGGHGGQSVNTTDSAVRITHLPTGITVVIQNERSQLQNKQTALKILNSKLVQLKLEQHAEKISELKGPDQQAAWGRQARNYVMQPYTLVKDVRTGHETKDVQRVLDGELDDFVEAYLEHAVSD
jgi:peptide chain release factor 2